ncbi:hypothetical protein [Streptomyces sp. MMG1121]|uniref:hypothetical protein n=1 Tax=Streptomyces sp. MMG1121 TaxID=1415544 RepID=UPI00131AA48F|nr:hypothetical protein [Streptomyces sp. MMG1121]
MEEACQEWGRFLDDYTGISSARGDEHLAILRASIRPYASLAVVRALDVRAREVARLKAA